MNKLESIQTEVIPTEPPPLPPTEKQIGVWWFVYGIVVAFLFGMLTFGTITVHESEAAKDEAFRLILEDLTPDFVDPKPERTKWIIRQVSKAYRLAPKAASGALAVRFGPRILQDDGNEAVPGNVSKSQEK